MRDGDEHYHATYVVRIWRDGSGEIRGVVVRVATGERFAFERLDRMGPLLHERVTTDIGG